MKYNWPGNIRELKNCITRAAVMAEGKIIQANEIGLDTDEPDLHPSYPLRCEDAVSGEHTSHAGDGDKDESIPFITQNRAPLETKLNPRQKKAYPIIMNMGGVTRSEYQAIVGNDLPSRTAIYDLQDLIKKGLLKKVGKGPATRYVPTESH